MHSTELGNHLRFMFKNVQQKNPKRLKEVKKKKKGWGQDLLQDAFKDTWKCFYFRERGLSICSPRLGNKFRLVVKGVLVELLVPLHV